MRTFLAVLYSSIGFGVLATLVIYGFGADAWSEQFLGLDPKAGPFWPGLTIFGICAEAIALATLTIFYWSEWHEKRLEQQKRKAREARYGRELTAAEHREEDSRDFWRVADAMSGRPPRQESWASVWLGARISSDTFGHALGTHTAFFGYADERT